MSDPLRSYIVKDCASGHRAIIHGPDNVMLILLARVLQRPCTSTPLETARNWCTAEGSSCISIQLVCTA